MKWFRRILLAVLVIALAGAGAWWLFPRPISEALFRSLVSMQRLPADSSEPGLHVYLCGTGSPLPDPTRSGMCIGVVAGGRAFVIDPGEGGARRLMTMGFPAGQIEAVFLSHLHSDHIDGLANIILQSWIVGSRKEPLPVYGPKGVERVVEGVNTFFSIDSAFRTAHHGEEIAAPSGYGATAHVVPLVPFKISEIISEEDLKVSFTEVSHAPVHPAMGLRIDHAGRSISFSGDTLYDPRFVKLSEGVDLMIHDAMQHWMIGAIEDQARTLAPDAVAPQILRDIVDYHASPEDAARAAQKAGAKALVLTHVAPALPSKLFYPAFMGDAPNIFDGPVTVAEDGMMFSYAPKP